MMIKNMKLFILIILAMLFASISQATAQPSPEVEILSQNADGSYLLKIDGKRLLAIPEQAAQNALKTRQDLKTAKAEIALKDSLLAQYERNLALYDSTMQHLRNYNVMLEDTYQGYKKLYGDYKRLKYPWVSLEGGIGATGGDWRPAVMFGVRVLKVHVWGFLQERNSGALVGAHFDLF